MHHPTLSTAATAVALLATLPGASAGMYTKNSPVLQVDAKNFDRLINKSNYTSVVEFYAPWCGHCQNLKPAYEKAAKNLNGLAKVAAIDCDDDANKPLCGQMGVEGFPTLKIVRPIPGKKRPAVEDYNGPRTAKGIVDAVVDRMNNHVKRVTDKDLDDFLAEKNETAKAILFSDKGTTTALLKGVAIDFLDVITIGQIRDKEAKAVELFGIEEYPTLVLLPGGEKDSIVYDGELKKDAIVQFLFQAGSPNPDPAPVSSKKAAKQKEKAPETDTSEEASEHEEPIVAEAAKPVAPPSIPVITSQDQLIQECLNEDAHTCVLAIVPPAERETAARALEALADVAHKYTQRKRKLFPIFEIAGDESAGAAELVQALNLSGKVELIAVNARRGWWRHFEGVDFAHGTIESWIDAIRMGDGDKQKLPKGVVSAAEEEQVTPEPIAEATDESTAEPGETKAADPMPESETDAHDEL